MSAHIMDIRDESAVVDFSRTLDMLKTAENIPVLYIKIPWMLYRSSRALKKIREKFERCSSSCGASCLDEIIEKVKPVRDSMVFIFEKMNRIKLLAPLRSFVESAVIDWDDFVEDCTVASDPEIRNMICSIADGLRA